MDSQRAATIIALTALTFGHHQHTFAAQDVADALIPKEFPITEPLIPCEIPTIVGFVAAFAGVPAGVEHVPGDCDYSKRKAAKEAPRRSMQGWTVREALDFLVAADPRYTWAVLDGVISFRPTAAINYRAHFLHAPIGRFELVNGDLHDAFAALMGRLGVRYVATPSPRTPQASEQFSIPASEVTAVQALDEIVRRHRAMRWEVSYCKPALARSVAVISLVTFDKGGVIFQVDQSFRSKGEVNPCGR